jgi:hypothetical protein
VSVANRASGGKACPFCTGHKVSVTNSLASLHPNLVEQWHPTKNGDLAPEHVVAGTEKKVWWRCPHGPDHEWSASVVSRTRLGSGCPWCSERKASVTNSLARLYPELAKQWHPTKNGDLTPEQVPAGSSKKVWWKCPNGSDHAWEAAVYSRASGGRGCPYCGGYRVLFHRSSPAHNGRLRFPRQPDSHKVGYREIARRAS